MIVLILCLFFCPLTQGKADLFRRLRNHNCNFNYKNEKLDATNGGFYSSHGGSIFSVNICCDPSMNASVYNLDIGKREKNCCFLAGHHRAIVGGIRICAGVGLLLKFSGDGKDVIESKPKEEHQPKGLLPSIVREEYTAPGDHSLCPTSTETDKLWEKIPGVGDYKLIQIVESGQCKDQKKPFHVKFLGVANGFKKHVYSWCCSKDIYADYTLDPKNLCCGLSGAQSRFFAKGSYVLFDEPPCCRKSISPSFDGTREPCEPFLFNIPSKKIPYRSCPPTSGIYNVTTDLDETVPALGPYSYAFPNKVSTSNDLYSQSECPSKSLPKKFKSYKYFYSMSNMYDRLTNKEGPQDGYGLCCTEENMFAKSPKTILKSCCITGAPFKNIAGQKNHPCVKDPDNVKIGKSFLFLACQRSACHGGRVGSIRYDNVIRYKVGKPKHPFLYGSEIFFVSKNEKVPPTSSVSIP